MSRHLKLFIVLLSLYIGLGLPDSLLSTTWPDISTDLGISIGYISLFSIITIFFSMVSSSNTHLLNKWFGPTVVILLSMGLCLSGLLIFLVFRSFASLIVVQMIMGLGAGAIDSNVNFIASQNLRVGEMNLLHGFWGVGVTLTPLITAVVYQLGYNEWMVFLIVALLFVGLIWYGYINRNLLDINIVNEDSTATKVKLKKVDLLAFAIYFMYGVEFIIGTFLATYLVAIVGCDSALAAFVVACYWAGLTLSRLLMPFIFKYIKSYKVLVIHSLILIVCSLLIQIPNVWVLMPTFVVIGFCFGPIFPTFMHYTERVNREHTGYFIGKQISCMYLSIFLFQILVGYFATIYSLAFFSLLVAVMILLLITLILIYLKVLNNKLD